MATEAASNQEENAPKGGELVFCGATQWEVVGRRTAVISGTNILAPTRLRNLMGVNICFVAADTVLVANVVEQS